MSSTTPSGGGLQLPEPPQDEQPPRRGSPRDKRRPGFAWATMILAVVLAALVATGVTLGVVRATQPATQATADATPPQEPASAADTDADEAAGEEESLSISAVAEAVRPSVPRVEVTGPRGQGAASAVIFREDGYLLTNYHVVRNAQQVRVTLPDGEQHEAEIVGTDPRNDLAVLHLPDADSLPVPEFSQSAPEVGERVVAIGSPFGLEGTVTFGIVSALNREVTAQGLTLPDMIQTDAAINPGNSGGALANMQGEVIGINTAIVSSSGTSAGVGFAIPIQSALDSARQLVEQGFVEYAQIGILGETLDPQTAELYDLGVDEGVVIREVLPDTGAADADLQRGDIITAIDDTEIGSMSELIAAVRDYSPGDSVKLTIVRNGEEQTVEVTLTARRSGQDAPQQ